MAAQFLYKYLTRQLAETTIKEGSLLFRNLAYFRQYEDPVRGDPVEGSHVDRPDNGFTITKLDTDVSVTGNFSFLNSIDPNKTFVYCLSKTFDSQLYEEFSCDACLVIRDRLKFIKRCLHAVSKLMARGLVDRIGLISRDVYYYAANEAVQKSVKVPLNVPFFKLWRFSHQDEYRLVFGYPGAFKLTKRIVDNDIFDFRQDVLNGTPQSHLLRIGNIEDIAEIRFKT